MGSLDEFPFGVRTFLRAYPWRRIDPVPWAPLRRPLAESRLAIVATAGLVPPGAEPFDADRRGGDPSFRVVPGDLDVAELAEGHRSSHFDATGLRADRNVAFPLDRARELVAAGRLGSLSPEHLSFMGSITAPGRLVRDTAPAAADILVAHEVDVALLVPV